MRVCYLISIPIEGNLWVAIVLGGKIWTEINVLTSNLTWLGCLLLDETHRYPKISLYQRQDSDSDPIINFSCIEVKYRVKED